MIHGVLFDYSGTLFRFEPGPGWPSVSVDEAARERLTHVLTHPTMSGDHLPPDLHDAWARRDLDPEVHRTVFTSLHAQHRALSSHWQTRPAHGHVPVRRFL